MIDSPVVECERAVVDAATSSCGAVFDVLYSLKNLQCCNFTRLSENVAWILSFVVSLLFKVRFLLWFHDIIQGEWKQLQLAGLKVCLRRVLWESFFHASNKHPRWVSSENYLFHQQHQQHGSPSLQRWLRSIAGLSNLCPPRTGSAPLGPSKGQLCFVWHMQWTGNKLKLDFNIKIMLH